MRENKHGQTGKNAYFDEGPREWDDFDQDALIEEIIARELEEYRESDSEDGGEADGSGREEESSTWKSDEYTRPEARKQKEKAVKTPPLEPDRAGKTPPPEPDKSRKARKKRAKARRSARIKQKRKRSGIAGNLFLIFLMIVGVGVMAYPRFSDWWNNLHQSRAIAGYVQQIANMDKETFDRLWSEAEQYNEVLRTRGDRFTPTEADTEEYVSVLDVTGTGIMGYIDIPKINVELPIYHGTDEAVLQIAIGHIEGSSLPVGGYGTHCALSGHRGLPSARLFTDIDQLGKGDQFFLQVLDRTLAYEVDQVKVVLPDEMRDLDIDADSDFCTLITCTPYGVNTHRMLVRGRRVEVSPGKPKISVNAVAEAILLDPLIMAPLVVSPLLLILIINLLITTALRRKELRDEWEYMDE